MSESGKPTALERPRPVRDLCVKEKAEEEEEGGNVEKALRMTSDLYTHAVTHVQHTHSYARTHIYTHNYKRNNWASRTGQVSKGTRC